MKKIGRKLLLAVSLVLLSATFTACNKEIEFEGTLYVETPNVGGTVYIYAVGEDIRSIMEFTVYAADPTSVTLLAGNYTISASNGRSGFQIRPGKTTTVNLATRKVIYE